MIRFDTKNEGTWFWVVEGKLDVGICLRPLTDEEHRSIEKITVRTKKKVKRGVAYDDVTTDERLASKMINEKSIVDWKGFLIGDDEEEAECNAANKVRIMLSEDFRKFYLECLTSLNETNKTLDEARLGN